MPASNAYYFFDGRGFRKTGPARTFFLGVFEALGFIAVTVFKKGSAVSAWFLSNLMDWDYDELREDG